MRTRWTLLSLAASAVLLSPWFSAVALAGDTLKGRGF